MANSTPKGPKGSKKTRKYGRDTKKCARYRAEGRREKNKARKARKEGARRATGA